MPNPLMKRALERDSDQDYLDAVLKRNGISVFPSEDVKKYMRESNRDEERAVRKMYLYQATIHFLAALCFFIVAAFMSHSSLGDEMICGGFILLAIHLSYYAIENLVDFTEPITFFDRDVVRVLTPISLRDHHQAPDQTVELMARVQRELPLALFRVHQFGRNPFLEVVYGDQKYFIDQWHESRLENF